MPEVKRPKAGEVERRAIGELRASQGDEGSLVLRGYAARFNVESHDLGGFRETISRGAFSRSLDSGKDVVCLRNHDAGVVLGRRSAGTLDVSEDDNGLHFVCRLDPKQQSHVELHSSVARGDTNGCSFSFTVAKDGQAWSEKNGYTLRTLTDLNLLDVSAVTFPAYPSTSIAARQAAVAGVAPSTEQLRARLATIDGDWSRRERARIIGEQLRSNQDWYAPRFASKQSLTAACQRAMAKQYGAGCYRVIDCEPRQYPPPYDFYRSAPYPEPYSYRGRLIARDLFASDESFIDQDFDWDEDPEDGRALTTKEVSSIRLCGSKRSVSPSGTKWSAR